MWVYMDAFLDTDYRCRSSSRIGRKKNQQGDGQYQIQIQRYTHTYTYAVHYHPYQTLTHMTIEGNLNGYQKKKYVCKLLYMYILGWEIDFGHLEAVNLISSQKYSEKQIVGPVVQVKERGFTHVFG